MSKDLASLFTGKPEDVFKIPLPKQPKVAEDPEDRPRQGRSSAVRRRDKHIYRRAFSETQLLDILGMDFRDGESYHVITGGDVDALSYLKLVIRQQDLEHCLFSTWCMAMEDVYQFKEWLQSGRIKHLDAYVGEIFPNSYTREWEALRPLIKEYGGRIIVFRNHAKIFAGYGSKFYFGIESSANINTNPRTENGCITIGQEIYEFYRDYFEGIISFVKEDREP